MLNSADSIITIKKLIKKKIFIFKCISTEKKPVFNHYKNDQKHVSAITGNQEMYTRLPINNLLEKNGVVIGY